MAENFVIDLTMSEDTTQMINNISNAFETSDKTSKEIVLKLKDFQLNQSQILSIKSLIMSYGSTLYGVETTSLITKQLLESMNIPVLTSDIIDEISKSIEEKKVEIEQEKVEYSLENQAQVDSSLDVIYGKQEDNSSAPKFYSFDNAKEFNEKSEETVETDWKENENQDITDEKIYDNDEEMAVYTKGYDENEDEEIIEEITYNPPTDEPVVAEDIKTLYVNQTLRSGQVVEYDGNVVIIGDCHPGSEVKATGDITIWGILGSIAHAGIKGNREAKIRALKMNAVQLRIADCYSRRPDGTNIPYIVKSSTFTPEEARIVDNGIVLYKTYQKESK